ncbi:hypothetical protein [Psychrobacter sp. WY6]|uniref:hypothetical protein n=1 Tax=Psychrobacter sp. WY6 TaxID=2708350 RepID=UPI002022D81D|nr:hypothetical protein [Psychrobacter sp. WY6]
MPDMLIQFDIPNTELMPSGYKDMQVVINDKANVNYNAMFKNLAIKYSTSHTTSVVNNTNYTANGNFGAYITSLGAAYQYIYQKQNVLPKRTLSVGGYRDDGYEPHELAYYADFALNSVNAINERLSLAKYLI